MIKRYTMTETYYRESFISENGDEVWCINSDSWGHAKDSNWMCVRNNTKGILVDKEQGLVQWEHDTKPAWTDTYHYCSIGEPRLYQVFTLSGQVMEFTNSKEAFEYVQLIRA